MYVCMYVSAVDCSPGELSVTSFERRVPSPWQEPQIVAEESSLAGEGVGPSFVLSRPIYSKVVMEWLPSPGFVVLTIV